MAFQEIKALIEKAAPKFILILCHQNADPDALCSVFTFSKFLEHLYNEVKIEFFCPEGISKLSKALINYIPIKLTNKEPNINEADIIVLLDTNTIMQLGRWSKKVRNSSSPIVIIDHHTRHPESEKLASLYISEENSTSTCEIIYNFFKELSFNPSREEANAFFLGIVYDTKHFILAKSSTFKIASELIEAGVNVEEIFSLFSIPMDNSERIARLKASQRIKIQRFGVWIATFSYVKSYQASVARALVEMGAHIAMVCGERDNELQISIRSSQKFYRESGFHLGRDLAKPLGEHLKGMGGGHPTAAGINGFGDFKTAVKYASIILKEKLGLCDS
jgi:nanoRNase/pAp phosphatase (c-di-AMP/oligoRNAs hydrolase)